VLDRSAEAQRILDIAEVLNVKAAVLDRREAARARASCDQQAVESECAAVRGRHGPAIGVAIGLPIALATTRLVSSQLFGITPTDPLTWTAATALMIGVAAIAGVLPASRASRVDPMVALRCE